ncbi:MAG: hypothetical protein JRG91_20025 [Deltaproteobacteria bacterium]|nr:hypothetical protein [Deltaproteobacteria bacterium]
MGTKFDAALTGFNNNFKHKGKVYHLQTEDSGEGHPHIITHVFVDGGHIIATRKASYEEYLGRQDLKEHVKSLMREQHKAMALAIRDGVFDDDQPYPREVKESKQGSHADEKKKSRLRGISGVYRSVRRRGSKPPPPPSSGSGTQPVGRPSGIGRTPGSIPAARVRPPREVVERSDRVFGEDLLTDKTLEEVIASYLTEDVGKG